VPSFFQGPKKGTAKITSTKQIPVKKLFYFFQGIADPCLPFFADATAMLHKIRVG
jgi:hypothetical protein